MVIFQLSSICLWISLSFSMMSSSSSVNDMLYSRILSSKFSKNSSNFARKSLTTISGPKKTIFSGFPSSNLIFMLEFGFYLDFLNRKSLERANYDFCLTICSFMTFCK